MKIISAFFGVVIAATVSRMKPATFFRNARTYAKLPVAAGIAPMLLLAFLCTALGISFGQTRNATPADPLSALPKDRLPAVINNNVTATLSGVMQPQARPENDAGPVPGDRQMSRITLSLKRDSAQQAALDAFSADIQDPKSPLFHHWITPEVFGAHFGVSQNDLARISNWLKDFGLTVNEIPPGHWTIIFSGTAAQVESAFHTAIHYYRNNGELRYANANEPQIPQDLATMVAGVAGLDNFRPRHTGASAGPHAVTSDGRHYLDPSDFATIYNLNPLYRNGILGNGVRIAVIEDCSMDVSLAHTFWNLEGIAQSSNAYWDYGAPPQCSQDDVDEVYLDYEWSGAVAPQAQIWLVSSGAANTLLGAVQGVVEYGVNNSAGIVPPPAATSFVPVITISYADCESPYDQATWVPLWQQAQTEGITALVSSGDEGAAGCDAPGAAAAATHGRAVNGICASPYVVCVGGTQFNDTANPAEYWSAAGSATGYIPEIAWNESGTLGSTPTVWGSSGGGYSAIQTKPAWQSANTSAQRGEPDIALSAASHDGYRICESVDPCNSSSISAVAGTSAAAPSFAGIMALLIQATGQSQGSPNPILYARAQQTSSGIFHDIVAGNNSVNGVSGYNASPGWDPVTGLGSVDATALVTNWPGSSAGIPSLRNISLSKVAPPSSGCTVPPSSASFLTSDGAVYLYFEATVQSSDNLSISWLAPNGDVVAGPVWTTATGTFCYTAAQLNVAGQPASHFGLWQARILDNGNQIDSISFTLGQGATAAPIITSLSPSSVVAGTGAFTLTVNGTGFSADAAVFANTASLPTKFVGATQLTATIRANLILQAGTLSITVSSGGDISNAQTIAIVSQVSSNLPRVGVLAQVASGGGWDTEIYLTNSSLAPRSIALTFYADSGSPVALPLVAMQQGNTQSLTASTFTAVIPSNTTLAIDSGGSSGSVVQGWADVHGDGAVTGFAVFRYAPQGLSSGPGIATPWEGTVPLQTLLTASTVIVPFDNTGGFATGLALGNLNTSGLNLTATFFDDNGNSLGAPQTVPLSGYGHTSFVLSSLFDFTANLKGLMKISGSGVMALGLRASPYGTLTSVPVPLQ